MRSTPDYYNCGNCDYHARKDGLDWCGRRDRRMRWNPVNFLCGAYCVGDDYEEPETPVEQTAPKVQRQTSILEWCRV